VALMTRPSMAVRLVSATAWFGSAFPVAPVFWLTMETVERMVSVSVWFEKEGRGAALWPGIPWDGGTTLVSLPTAVNVQ